MNYYYYSIFVSGFPIALSYPHFHHADPKLLENIEGSNPDPKLHETEFRLNQVLLYIFLCAKFKYKIKRIISFIGYKKCYTTYFASNEHKLLKLVYNRNL